MTSQSIATLSFASAETSSLPVPHGTVSAPSVPVPSATRRVDRVVATTAVEHVGAGGTGQRVDGAVAGDDIRAGTADHGARLHVVELVRRAVVGLAVERDPDAAVVRSS